MNHFSICQLSQSHLPLFGSASTRFGHVSSHQSSPLPFKVTFRFCDSAGICRLTFVLCISQSRAWSPCVRTTLPLATEAARLQARRGVHQLTSAALCPRASKTCLRTWWVGKAPCLHESFLGNINVSFFCVCVCARLFFPSLVVCVVVDPERNVVHHGGQWRGSSRGCRSAESYPCADGQHQGLGPDGRPRARYGDVVLALELTSAVMLDVHFFLLASQKRLILRHNVRVFYLMMPLKYSVCYQATLQSAVFFLQKNQIGVGLKLLGTTGVYMRE